MRTTQPLNALMPRVRQRILAATVLRPEKSWYLRELAEHLGLSPSSIQRELASLTEAGVLNKSTYGNRTYYHADQRCPIYPELTKILTKTVGVVDVARELLQPFSDRISVAFVYGSVASGTAGSGSDIDLLIVGDLGLVELSAPMEAAESRLGRAINPVILSPMEARHKLQNRQHFIESVRQSPKLFLLGEDHELGKALSR